MKYTQQMRDLIEAIDNEVDELPTDLEDFRESIYCSDGFEYGLLDGGYIKPELILEGDDLIKFNDALKIYEEVRDMWNKVSIEF